MDDLARFWSKVDTSGDCWIWTAGRDKDGYGRFKMANPRRTLIAHRFIFEAVVGPIPDGFLVMHNCDNPPCVKPVHLFSGTQADNAADRDRKNRTAKGDRSGNHIHVESRPRGEKHGRAKLTWDKVSTIRELHPTGVSIPSLARMFGVTDGAIWFIVRNQHWVRA